MPEDRYAPPEAPIAETRGEGTGSFEIGRCLSDGWNDTWANFPLWLGVGIVFAVVSTLAAITIVGIPLLLPVLGWGAVLFVLNMMDRRADLSDLFAGFSSYGSVLVTMLGLGILFTLISLVGQSIQIIGQLSGSVGLLVFGYVVNIAWTFLVILRLYFSWFFVVDQGLGAVASLGASWDATRGLTLRLVGLALVSSLIVVAGMLVLIVGLIPAMVIFYLMWGSAYRQIVGRPAAP